MKIPVKNTGPAFLSRWADTIIIAVAFVTIAAIPLRIIGEGYLPLDDALRHAAKVISGKDWKDILVMRDDIRMDSHPGWHFVLGCVDKITHGDAEFLVLFSVVTLFILFSIPAVFLFKRAEAWLAALLVFVLLDYNIVHLMEGRPFVVTMTVFLFICLWWPRLKEKKDRFFNTIILSAPIALAVWLHGCWYLFALPLIAFLLAREWQAARIMGQASLIGILGGAVLTGQPYVYLRQMVQHLILAYSPHSYLLVSEARSSDGNFNFLVVLFLMLIWRSLRKSSNPKLASDPVFWMAAMAWVMGLIIRRVFLDVGVTAFLVWMAMEFQEYFESNINGSSAKRILMAVVLSLALFLGYTSDGGNDRRWSKNLSIDYLYSENPIHAQWLPGPGGIIYSDDMLVFYDTFFKNPHADWRYVLGFEPGWMLPDDLAVYRRLEQFPFDSQNYLPWIKKMRPQDRLIITHQPMGRLGLEWYCVFGHTWIGRVPYAGKQDDWNISPAAQSVMRVGIHKCAGRVGQLTDSFNTMGKTGAVYSYDKTHPDQHLFSGSYEIIKSDGGSIYASASFAPTQNPGGEAVYDTVEYKAASREQLLKTVFNGIPVARLLRNNIMMLDAGSVKIFLVPAGKGCIVIKKAVVR